MIAGTRRNIGAVLAVGLAIGSAVALTSSGASGQEPPPETTADPTAFEGTLTIDLADRTGQVLLDEGSDGIVDRSEEIETAQPCAAIRPLSGDLLQFVANDGTSLADTVQIDDSALGISSDNSNCGNSNAGTINRSESLTIELGPYFDPLGVSAQSVTLNVDRFQRGDLKVGFDGATPQEVPLGGDPGELSGYPGTVVLTPETPFTSVTVTSTANNNAGVSIEDLTSFELTSEFDFAVDCQEQVSELGDTGESFTSAVFFRGENGPKTSAECVDVGVTVEIQDAGDPGVTDDRVFWVNSTVGVDGGPQDVTGLVTITAAPIPATTSPAQIDALLDREIDYDAEGPAPYTDLLWCESFTQSTITAPENPAESLVVLDATQPFIGIGTPGANVDGTAPWCLVADDRVLDGGAIFQTITLFGSGDPWFR